MRSEGDDRRAGRRSPDGRHISRVTGQVDDDHVGPVDHF